MNKLSEKYNDLSLRPAFGLANKFHANFYYDFMEDEVIAQECPLVRAFIRRILSMVDAPAS